MAWYQVGARYFYRNRRVGRRVIREYLGTGALAQLLADADALRRARRRAQAEARSNERACWHEAQELLRQLREGAGLLARAALLEAGYRQHDRGDWRRRRGRVDTMTGIQQATPETDVGLMDKLRALAKRANDGDQAALAALRQALDEHPVWRHYGDLAAQSQASWLQLIAGPDVLLGESVRRKAEELKTQLAGPSTTPIEVLLVDVVVATWLQVHYADAAYAQAGTQTTAAARAELQRRQDAAHRRHLAALKQLALVRKLLRSAVSPFEVALKMVPEATSPATRHGAVSRGGVQVGSAAVSN
jgi:hypothetical protein